MGEDSDFSFDSNVDKVSTIVKTRRLDKKYGKVTTLETKKRDPLLPPSVDQKLREDVPKMKVITANDLSIKYDIRVSTIKKFLKDLHEEDQVELVSTSSRLKVYRGSKSKK
jgi:ribosomal protein S25